MEMSEVDLHFWVVKNGEIIDKSLSSKFKKMLGYIGGQQLVYYPYPEEINNRIVEEEKEVCKKRMTESGTTWEKRLEEGRDGSNDGLFKCIASSFCYAYWNGGKVQVGCCGFKTKDGKIQWLYSHPDNSYDNYRRDVSDTIVNYRHTDPKEHEGQLIWTDKLDENCSRVVLETSQKKKQKPNEKCACGSDLKYKKCCGKN